MCIGCSSQALYINTTTGAADYPAISFKRVRNVIGGTGPSYTLVDLGDRIEYNGRIVFNSSVNPYRHYRDTGMQIRNIEYLSVSGDPIVGTKHALATAIREKRDRRAQVIGVTGSGSDELTWRRPPGTMMLVVVSPHVEAAYSLERITVEAGASYLVEFDSAQGRHNVVISKQERDCCDGSKGPAD